MNEAATGRPSRGSLLLTLLLLAGIAAALSVYFLFAGSNPFSGGFSDSVRYLFMADYFAGDDGPLARKMMEGSMFPPLFPLVLGLLGGGSANIAAGHLGTVASLVLACGSFYWWLSENRVPRNQGLGAILLTLLLPGVFFHSLVIASEFLFIALTLASLAAVERGGRSPRWLYAAALLAGLAIVTRTVGIALLPGLLLACRSGPLRRLAGVAVLALSPFLLWRLLRDVPYSGIGYLEWFTVYLERFTPAEIIQNVWYQLKVLWFSWIRIFDRMVAMHVVVLYSLLMVAAGAVWAARLARLRTEAVFLLAYLAIIVLWPFPDQLERFVFVLVPFYFFYGLLALRWLASKYGLTERAGLLRAAAAGVVLVSIVPSLLFYQHRFSLEAPDEIRAHRFSQKWYEAPTDREMLFRTAIYDQMFKVAGEIGGHIGEDDCVYATFADVVSLYSGRWGVNLPLDLYEESGAGPADSLNKLGLCEHVLMVGLGARQVPQYESMYPIRALEGRIEPILLSNLTRDGEPFTAAAFARIVREPPAERP